MKLISTNDVHEWYKEATDFAEFTRSIGARHRRDDTVTSLDLPYHLQFVIEKTADEREGPVEVAAFDSIPFHSLCRGLFLPISAIHDEKIKQLFGIVIPANQDDQPTLIKRFLDKKIGLSLKQKMACLLGDPFMGRKSTFRRDSLLRLLLSMRFISRNAALDRLTTIGDIASLFAEQTQPLKSDPPLSTLEVLETLRFLPDIRMSRKFEILRSLFERCGKLEAYFLVKLLLRSAGFGFDYQGMLLSRILGERFKIDPDAVNHAMALTDPMNVAEVLETEGSAGLKAIQLKPLSPVRPALAGGTTDDIKKYPIWVERKYDGIRLLVHKSTDAAGTVLCGAYTRNRGDWIEIIPGMAATARLLPAHTAIIDGELYGTIVDLEGVRPASVYEVYTAIQGEAPRPVQMRYAVFDLLYLNGKDLTSLPLSSRRQVLSNLMTPFTQCPTPIPVVLSEGQMAANKEDVNRLFSHFRSQGYEGIIAKDWSSVYYLATRDQAWMKRKPEITLDLVLLGGVLAVTNKENVGMFGSYVIGAANALGGFDVVGDVAGLDKARDLQIQNEVMRQGLLTGKRIERISSSGTRPGLEFRPAIVVTVKFEGIIREAKTEKLSLRDPKIVLIRSDKSAFEADDTTAIERLYIDQRMG